MAIILVRRPHWFFNDEVSPVRRNPVTWLRRRTVLVDWLLFASAARCNQTLGILAKRTQRDNSSNFN
jgi:hypothetical protein